MSERNVLRVNGVEERNSFRDAVAEMLRCIQADHKVTLLEIAERIDVSLGTISNAANKKTDLCAAYVSRLACAYGPATLDPFARLSGGRVIPLDAGEEIDALPSMTAAVHRLAVAQSPNSTGGQRITHGELLDMEGEIDAALASLTALKVRCSTIRLAA